MPKGVIISNQLPATAVEWKHQSYLVVKNPLLTYKPKPIEHDAYDLIPHD